MNVAIRRALDQPQRIYAADGSALPQRGQTRAWDEAAHPRGPDGKFTAGGLRVPSGPMLMPHPEGDEFYATRLPNSSLSDADRAVALEYAWGGPAFERMNRALRGDPDTEVTPEVAEDIAKLTGVISHHHVPPTKVYRGVPDDEKTRAWLASRDSKGHIVDHGFMSTSTDEQIALDAADPTGDGGGVVFEIKLPQGTQAMALGDLFDEEGGFDQREVLVQRGSKFKVGRRRKVDGRTHIQLTMVSQIPRTGAAGRSGWNEAAHPRGPGGKFIENPTSHTQFDVGDLITLKNGKQGTVVGKDVFGFPEVQLPGNSGTISPKPERVSKIEKGAGTHRPSGGQPSAKPVQPAPPPPVASGDEPLTGKQAHASLPRPQQVPGMTDAEQNAIADYQQSGHLPINNVLRHGVGDERSRARAAAIQSAFRKVPPTTAPIEVSRSVSGIGNIMGPIGGRTGETFVDRGVVSTTTDPGIFEHRFGGGDGRMDILVPPGMRALRGSFDEVEGLDEQEVLLPPGTAFRVLTDDLEPDPDDPDGTIRVMRLEAIAPTESRAAGRAARADQDEADRFTWAPGMIGWLRVGEGRAKWDEADHPRGPGGRFSSAGSVVVIDPSVYREAFFNEPDPVARAADLYSDTMQGMNLIRTVIRNKQAGRSPFDDGDGRDVRDGDDYYLLQQHLLPLGQIKDPLSGDVVYGPEDLDREIIGAADLIERQIRQAPPATVPLSRGTRIPQSDLPNPGDEFDAGNAGVTSWTTDQDRADRYSMPGDLVEDGRRVRIVLDGPVPAHDLGSQKRTSRTGDDGEHLVGGGQRVRVASVEKQGDGPRAIFEIRVVPV